MPIPGVGRPVLRAALALALLLPAAAAAGIFGRNDVRLPGAGDPVAAVGAIDCPASRFRGTGFLVARGPSAPPALVTAGHVLIGADRRPRGDCRYFPAGRVDAARPDEGWPVTIEAEGAADPYHAEVGDWAVAAVAIPPGAAPATLPVAAIPAPALAARRAAGDRFLLIGYHQPMDRLMVSDRCGPVDLTGTRHAFEGEARLMVHDCDAILGWSGGPLVLATADGPVAVGYHYAGSTGGLPFAVLGGDTGIAFALGTFENHAHGFAEMPDLMAAIARDGSAGTLR